MLCIATYYQPTTMKTSRLPQILLGVLFIHLIWVILSLVVHSPVLPMPWAVYQHLPQAWSDMPTHLWASLGRIAQGIAYSLSIALIIALAIYRYTRLGRALEAFIYLSYPIPKLALLPVVMLIAGLGEATKVIMIVLIILFQLVVGIRDSLKGIPRESFAIMRSLGATSWQELRHLLLPAITPDLLSALRIAIGTAISVLFVTETYGTIYGMGYYIVDAWMRVDYLGMYGGIVVLSLLGFALFVAIDTLEWVLCRWRR